MASLDTCMRVEACKCVDFHTQSVKVASMGLVSKHGAMNEASLVCRPFYARSACFHMDKRPGIQRLCACRIISGEFCILLYIIGVYYVMNIGRSQSMVSIVVV